LLLQQCCTPHACKTAAQNSALTSTDQRSCHHLLLLLLLLLLLQTLLLNSHPLLLQLIHYRHLQSGCYLQLQPQTDCSLHSCAG
jgi:hypothetical protein